MTYCVALYLRDGLVFLSDTRTNAGVDHIATYPKSFIIETPGERALVLMTAGNLATTQAVVNEVIEGHSENEDGPTLYTVSSMVGAAELVGKAVRRVLVRDSAAFEAQDLKFDASFILGGQIKDRRMRLFEIYSAGNFIEASVETPFLQIGEHKYGKPILDRALSYETTSVADGIKLALVSMDSTVRSNLTVGLPVDLTTYKRDECKIDIHRRIAEDDPYFAGLRETWSNALRSALQAAPPARWDD